MNFNEAENYLLSLGNEVASMKLGLENVSKLYAELGDPQKNYLKVQVAGTNGKGSVCAFLNSICLSAGVRTGMYTSPHLNSITERIQINGANIDGDQFARIATRVRTASDALVERGQLKAVPTFFEQVTAIALLAFAEAKVELAILETGLGGRLDATTAADAEIAAITRIDLDHQNYLGDTIEEIAGEKAAIIHEGSRVCIGEQYPEALDVVLERCAQFGIRPRLVKENAWQATSPGFDFSVDGLYFGEVILQLEGEHQAENAALAIVIAHELKALLSISSGNIIEGLESARHLGRLQWLERRRVRVLLDGAHNRGGAETVVKYLQPYWAQGSIALVYAAMNDKDYKAILDVLEPIATDVIFTEPKNARARSAQEMADAVRPTFGLDRVFAVTNVSDALDAAIELASTYPVTRPSMVLVTGSLYLVGEALALLTSGETDN